MGLQPIGPDNSGVETKTGYVDDLYNQLKSKDPNLQLMKLGCSIETTTSMLHGHTGSDVGANDVEKCATSAGIDVACAVQGIASISTNLPQILGRLKLAGGPEPIYTGMSYYNPLLAAWLSPDNGKVLAALTSLADYIVNTIEQNEYHAFGWGVADVSGAFKSYDYFTQIKSPLGTVPLNVYNICALTWMCLLQNIHANNAGYLVIANAFAAVLPKVPA